MAATTGEAAKRDAGRRAAELVRDGMVVGLGTGSTVLFAMEGIGERVREGMEVLGVPTSHQAALRAQALGIPLTTLDEHPAPDLAIDGADQADPAKRLIKGRGAALAREKVVAGAAREFVVVADPGKCVPALAGFVPVEVIPFAMAPAARRIADLCGNPVLREGAGKDGPVVTDNGNFVLDCAFGPISAPEELEADLTAIPGVLACGLFTAYTGKTRLIVGGKKKGT